ncbi:DNA damage-inducible protein 1 [Zancudomyces culisetae]|uniref:DNA damage-inducible protein 1 n=1 Tax=Zancudomyces culisetae TaxID=1213189 RepID=A0A1R1PNU1_ZANCU|nr:DNA damage-inducible protein 1 [Zancudomyces culisetae]|eukprot:OMH82628.1 DNA damage-inducible protein 1 [Zancudomyces culisetae]
MITPKTFESDMGIDPEDWADNYRLVAKQNNWDEGDWIDLVRLYLGKKEAIWYKKNKEYFTSWDEFSKLFIEKFSIKETKCQVWDKLRNIKHSDYNSIEELEYDLELLCEKAGITKDDIKLDLLVSTLKAEHKEKLEETGYKSWDKVIKFISNLEKSEQGVYRKSEYKDKVSKMKELSKNAASRQGRTIKDMSKDKESYAAMIRKFEELSVSLLAKVDEVVDKKLKSYRPENTNVYKCFYCQEEGHNKFECQKWKAQKNQDSNSKINSNVNFIDIVGEKESDSKQLFAVEKRKNNSLNDTTTEIRARKRNNTAATSTLSENFIKEKTVEKNVEEIDEDVPLSVQIQKRYNPRIQNGTKAFSLRDELNKVYPKISLIQLLDSSPILAKALVGLCNKKDTSEINEISIHEWKITNCRAQVQIFGQDISAVIDTGAACSVVGPKMVECWGLDIDSRNIQIIITTDGKKHPTLGKINNVPVKIASVILPANLVVMEKNEGNLILGTDWLLKHRAIINLKVPEIRFPIENSELITRLTTTTQIQEDETEMYYVVKEAPKGLEADNNSKLAEVTEEFDDIFVDDISELKQASITKHKIELTDEKPIKQKPYC